MTTSGLYDIEKTLTLCIPHPIPCPYLFRSYVPFSWTVKQFDEFSLKFAVQSLTTKLQTGPGPRKIPPRTVGPTVILIITSSESDLSNQVVITGYKYFLSSALKTSAQRIFISFQICVCPVFCPTMFLSLLSILPHLDKPGWKKVERSVNSITQCR